MEVGEAVHRYIEEASESARPALRSRLNAAAQHLEPGTDSESCRWDELDCDQLEALVIWLGKHRTASTARKVLQAVRGVIRRCAQAGLLDPRSADGLSEVRCMPGPRPGIGLAAHEIRRALGREGASEQTARGRVMVGVLYGLALTAEEAVGLQWDDVDREHAEVRGASGSRRVPVPAGLEQVLAPWLECCGGRREGPVLRPLRRGGTVAAAPLTAAGLRTAVASLGKAAGVARLDPGRLRDSGIRDMLRIYPVDLVRQYVGVASCRELIGLVTTVSTDGDQPDRLALPVPSHLWTTEPPASHDTYYDEVAHLPPVAGPVLDVVLAIPESFDPLG